MNMNPPRCTQMACVAGKTLDRCQGIEPGRNRLAEAWDSAPVGGAGAGGRGVDEDEADRKLSEAAGKREAILARMEGQVRSAGSDWSSDCRAR